MAERNGEEHGNTMEDQLQKKRAKLYGDWFFFGCM